METLLWTALFIPFVGFLVLLCFSSVLSRRAVELIGPSTIFISFLLFCYILQTAKTDPIVNETSLFTWIPIQGLSARFALHLDHLSMLMTLIITGVGFLIHAYSVGYMDHEEDLARYFSVMNFFIFSMLLLVLSANLLLFFVGWEGVGVASYLLIGYWYHKPAAEKAAKKAFVVNRIGDLGLLLGIFLTYMLFGTSDIQEVCMRAGKEFAVGAPVITCLTLLYFWGACGKSAQMPLQTWLPDAMEGPTPVSALIHAATMVTAGVYLVVRMHPVFEVSPFTLEVVGYVGAITALYAAACATSQTDVKRVLAYSTVSQLGLMFLACGVKAYFAAMFHLTTHAFVKALLFMSAGNVIHMMHGTTEMAKMGGLSKVFTKTNILFLIGVLSMAGIPPFAIFFSKDLIIEEEFASGRHPWFIGALIISLLTAFYLARAYFLTFRGPSRVQPSFLKTVSEAPSVMILPVSILAALSVVGGLLGFSLTRSPILMAFLEKDTHDFQSAELAHGWHASAETFFSILVAVTGFGVAAHIYTHYQDKRDRIIQFCYKAFYINELYDALIVRPMRHLAVVIAKFFEPKLYDTSVEATAKTSTKTAAILQAIQSGQIRSYISWLVLGASFLIIYLCFEAM